MRCYLLFFSPPLLRLRGEKSLAADKQTPSVYSDSSPVEAITSAEQGCKSEGCVRVVGMMVT